MDTHRHSLRVLMFTVGLLVATSPSASAHHPDLVPAGASASAGEATVSSEPPVFEGYERIAGQRVLTSVHGESVTVPRQSGTDGASANPTSLARGTGSRVRDHHCNRIENQKRRKKCRGRKQENEGQQVPPTTPATPETPAPQYSPWCGDDAYTDVNPVAPDVRRVKVIYARPAGAPSKFREYAPMIQSDVEFINDFFSQESGGTRSVRFDTGTSCGAGYIDIQIVNLPRSRAEYLAGDEQDRWSMLSQDLLAKLGDSRANYLVYADDLYLDGWATGMGSFYEDDSPLPTNASNTVGHGRAILFGAGGSNFLGSEGWDETRRRVLIHELLHTLGAVQYSAPHSTNPLPHCWDEQDVMCYQDSLLTKLLNMCPGPAFTIGSLDCNNNDYFDVTPEQGSYLASHWNVANSGYLVATPAAG